jgi:tetratricopeptide (TPR) repeat protein
MRILSKGFWMAMVLILLSMAGQAQEALLGDLFSQVFELYGQGRYPEATGVAKEAVKVAKETFGQDHPNVGISLNNLAYLYDCQGEYAQSGPLYKRALEILEKALGPEHFRVGQVLSNMAERSRKMGKNDEAERLEARAAKIRANR